MPQRTTPRTLIDALRPDHRRAYESLPLIGNALPIFDHLLADSGLGQSEDARFKKEGWNIRVQRVPAKRGRSSNDTYIAISFIKEIIARERGGEYAWSTGFSYKAARIETIRSFGPTYSPRLTFDLVAKGVMHFRGRNIDWENGPMNIELSTRVNVGSMIQEGDPLLPYSSFETKYLARNFPGSGMIVGDKHRKGVNLDHQRFTGLYDLASQASRSREEIGSFLMQPSDAW